MSQLYDVKSGKRVHKLLSFTDVLKSLADGHWGFDVQARLQGHRNWRGIMTIDTLAKQITGKLMLASHGIDHHSLFNHWYIKDGERRFGPFCLLQMLEFFHQRRLFPDNLVRHASFDHWSLFSEAGPFQPKSRQALLANPQVHHMVTRRKNPRIRYSNEIFVSSRGELHRAITSNLSREGLGFLTDNSTNFEMNHRVNIIINSNAYHETVQVTGHIVGLRRESNYERAAVRFDHPNQSLNRYLSLHLPRL